MSTFTLADRARVLDTAEWRVDGVEKVSGAARFAGDFHLPDMLWAEFATSGMAHARVTRVDVSKARQMPGVRAVLTGVDIGARRFGRRLFDWPILAVDRVRFIGEHIAAVAAETAEQARAAVAAIEIDYEPLPGIYDMQDACAAGAPILHEDAWRYHFGGPQRPPVPHPNVQGYELFTTGDLARGFAQADRVFEHTFTTPRYAGGYLEPRATLVWLDDNGIVRIKTTSKSPFGLRDAMATAIGIPKESIIIEPCYIGGDFGLKGLSLYEFPCYFLAAATRRPVKHVSTQIADMQSSSVRHASRITIRSGITRDGALSALEAHLLFDGGAYAAAKPSPKLLPGPTPRTPYRVANALMERSAVYTNSIPGGFMRAPGEIQYRFALESHIDMVAREIGMDPFEFRLRNVIREDGERDIDGVGCTEPRAVEVLEALRDAIGSVAPGRRTNVGIALSARDIGFGTTSVTMRVGPDQHVYVRSGCTEQGMGFLTMVQRVAATALEIGVERVHVSREDTASVPADPGVGGSRVTHIVGRATLDAAQKLRKALEEAGRELSMDGTTEIPWEAAAEQLLKAGPVEITGSYASSAAEPGHDEVGCFRLTALW